jgi:hypothetical protein
VRVNPTIAGVIAADQLGVTRTEVLCVLRHGLRLLEDIDDDTRAVTGRTAQGRLVSVWLRRLTDDEDFDYELLTAFEAGLTVETKWTHVFGRQSDEQTE